MTQINVLIAIDADSIEIGGEKKEGKKREQNKK